MRCPSLALWLDPRREIVERDVQRRGELDERAEAAGLAPGFDLAQIARRDPGSGGKSLASEATMGTPSARASERTFAPPSVCEDRTRTWLRARTRRARHRSNGRNGTRCSKNFCGGPKISGAVPAHRPISMTAGEFTYSMLSSSGLTGRSSNPRAVG